MIKVSFKAAALALSCLAGAATLSGCHADDLTHGNTGQGSFTATVSGDKSANLSGYAEIVSAPATSTTSATMIMGLADQNQAVITAIQFLGATSLSAQTYTVGAGNGQLAIKLVAGDGNVAGNTFTSPSGTVTITSISGSVVTGTFDIALVSDTNANIRETGSFQAVLL